MGRFGDSAIEEVRNRADIVEIIGTHVRLRRTGRNFVGLCPFHNEKTPSFSVNPERGFFHCFGCGAGGTVFNFIMRMEALTFPEAVRSLARRYGVSLPESEERGPAAAERDALARANQTAADFFHHVLWNTPDGAVAREYLKSRAITTETSRAFMLGFAPSRPGSLAKALEKRGLMDAGLKLGLIKRDEMGVRDAFRARAMFPIRDAQGRVIAFGGRVLDARLPKYLNSPESPVYSKARTLYGLYEARQSIASSDRVIIVEGYFDVIALWQAGFKETVASCGTSLTVDQLRVLGRYTRNVIACFDGDPAGRKASIRALEVFLQAGLLGKGIFIPSGFDPDTLIRERGAASFAEMSASPEDLADFFLQEQRASASKSSAARYEAARAVSELMSRVSDPALLGILKDKVGRFLGTVELANRRAARAGGGPRVSPAPPPAPRDAATKAEVGILAIAMLHPGMRVELSTQCPLDVFEQGEIGRTFAEICTAGDEQIPIEQLAAERLSPEQQGAIAELAVGALMDSEENARKLAQDYIAALEDRRRRRELEQLKRAASGTADGEQERAAAAQEVIALRRRIEQQRRGAS